MPAYSPAPEVEVIAKQIIQTTRPVLGHVQISYMFRPEAPVSDGKATAGMCVKVDDRNRMIHDHDFIIEIAKDIWELATDEYKLALVDHELGHAGLRTDEDGDILYDEKTNRPRTFIKKHDIEEFEDVLERHGAFHKGLRDFLDAFARNKASKSKPAAKTDEENLTPDVDETAVADVDETADVEDTSQIDD